MTKLRFLFAVVFGSMLAITGCGETTSGSAGSGGSGGTGGGMATGSCQTICNADCELFGPDPASATCASDCLAEDLDGCVPETTALVACADQAQGGNCNVDPTDSCQSQVAAFNACDSGSGGTAGDCPNGTYLCSAAATCFETIYGAPGTQASPTCVADVCSFFGTNDCVSQLAAEQACAAQDSCSIASCQAESDAADACTGI